MKKVTPKHAEKIIEDIERLRLAGVEVESDIDLGPSVTLRRVFRDDDRVTWEILPEVIAELTLQAIPENESEVAKARLFRIPPDDAPSDVVIEWIHRCGLRRGSGEDSIPSPDN